MGSLVISGIANPSKPQASARRDAAATLVGWEISVPRTALAETEPDEYYWNESIFYDWYDDAGSYAGHCRIGVHPNQDRVFVWFYLWDGASWVAIEEPRLPLGAFDFAHRK